MSPLPASLASLASVPGPDSNLGRLAARLLNVIFPPRCVGCERVGALFCDTCRQQVQPIPRPLCLRCGRPLPASGCCPECSQGQFAVSAIRAAGVYTEPLSSAIRQFKYGNQQELGKPLGQLLAHYWQERSVPADLVVPVPLHKQRLRTRGYNQARLLAITFCRQVGLPLLAPDVLCRVRDTRQQVLLDETERRQNVAGAFAWQGPHLTDVKVLLIDDVATTGSTLEACGEALLAAGAAKVWALTVARAVGPLWRG